MSKQTGPGFDIARAIEEKLVGQSKALGEREGQLLPPTLSASELIQIAQVLWEAGELDLYGKVKQVWHWKENT